MQFQKGWRTISIILMAIINTLNRLEKRVIYHPQATPEVRHSSEETAWQG